MTLPVNEYWGSYSEKPENLKHIQKRLVNALDKLDELLRGTLVVHCLYDAARDAQNYHRQGLACDCHFEGWHPIDMFLFAERQYLFFGIGIYGPDVWHNPGLHLDLRDIPGRWAFKTDGNDGRIQVPLSKKYINYLLNLMP
jgi:hypothetical protein